MSPEDAQEPTFEDTTPVKTSPVLETERKLARSGEMPPPESDPATDDDFDEFADTVFEADQPTVDGFHPANGYRAGAEEASAEATDSEAADTETDGAEDAESTETGPLSAKEADDDAARSRRKPTPPAALASSQGELDDELPRNSNKMLALIVAGVVLAIAALVYFGLFS